VAFVTPEQGRRSLITVAGLEKDPADLVR